MLTTRYRNSLALLQRINPRLAAWVEAGPDDNNLSKISAEPDSINPGMPSSDPHDTAPLETKRRKARETLRTSDRASVVFGLGPGYQVLAMAEIMPAGHVLFVVEENPAVVRFALNAVDFTPFLASNRLVLVPPDEEILRQLAAKLARRFRRQEVGIHIDETLRPLFSVGFEEKIARFQLDIQNEALAELFLIKDAALTVENEIRNLPAILAASPVGSLRNCFQGVPAVIVSAGPSLAGCVHHLRGMAGKAVVIATAPVLRVLKAHDLTPDLAAVMDFGVSNHEVFQDAYATEDVPLVFLQPTYHRIVRDYQGPLISVLSTDSPLRKWLAPHLPSPDHWPVGRNVGGFCLDLAIFIGADPIILVGQDLSFPDSTSHAEGVVGRRRIASGQGQVVLEGVGGRQVRSDLTHASYLQEFEAAIARAGRTIINTSPTGARIKGTVEMSLPAAAEAYCHRDYPIKAAIRDRVVSPLPGFQAVQAEIREQIREFEAFVRISRHACGLGRNILKQLRSLPEPQWEAITAHLSTYRQFYGRIEGYWRAFELLNKYLSAPIARLDEAWHRIETGRNGPEKMEAQLSTHLEMLEATIDETSRLIAMLGETSEQVGLLEFAMKSDFNPPADADGRLDAARAWVRLGRNVRAWDHYRAALALCPDDPRIAAEAAAHMIRRERPAQARLLAEPDDDAADGLVTDWMSRASGALQGGDWITALLLSRKVLAAYSDHEEARGVEQACLTRRAESINRNDPEIMERAS